MTRVEPAVFAHPAFGDYELLDSGAGEKLERFGRVVLRRPDPQALWAPRLSEREWRAAHLAFERDPESGGKRGRWKLGPDAPEEARKGEWTVAWNRARCSVRPTPFKHVGIFPEQAANWRWIESLRGALGSAPRLLNLFGYTGTASIVAAQSGFEVVHVDASKTSLEWARENAALSGLSEHAFKVVLDDALAFARREARRKQRYQAVLLDPPHHGRGPKGETWRFEEHVAPLVAACRELLAESAVLALSSYAIGTSALALFHLLGELGPGRREAGELALPESGERPRALPAGFCARFERGFP